MMKNKWVSKVAMVGLLAGLLLIATAMILGMIQERKKYQEEAVENIAASVSDAQRILGPVLVIPYKIYVNSRDSNTRETTRVVEERVHYVLPQELTVTGDVKVTPRKLGIYQSQLFAGKFSLTGSFGKINLEELRETRGFITFLEPYFVVSVSDTRGIHDVSSLALNEQVFDFKEGVLASRLNKGVHAPVSIDALVRSEINQFKMTLDLQGTQSLSVIPLGRKSHFTLGSDWKHPNFLGNTLPQTREMSEKGFNAHWESSWFANNMNDLFANGRVPDFRYGDIPAFSVSLIETVDEYQLNERTVKYAILFIGLTFIGFLIFEIISKLKIHPVQYTFVGASLVMFYLLLLALSEQIGFNLAYALASLTSSGLISVYLSSVLDGVKRGASFAASLLGLYGLLFLILNSQDMALLFGVLLLFMILAGLMLLTRKIDWYQISAANGVDTLKKKSQPSADVSQQTMPENAQSKGENAQM